jgi:zinc transporter, ZIP family
MGGHENVGIAFALVIGAGASTAIGSAVVFFPSVVKYASKKTLAAGLGLSAGVMTYVSFVEIFQKSVVGFVDSGIEFDQAYIYATLCFFGGIVLMVVSLVCAAKEGVFAVFHSLCCVPSHHSTFRC